jgi:hypothetical protein
LSSIIFETICPVVPDEVIVFMTSPGETLLRFIVLKSCTGIKGVSESADAGRFPKIGSTILL